jgi:cell division protein FtsW (lipid II flippase)
MGELISMVVFVAAFFFCTGAEDRLTLVLCACLVCFHLFFQWVDCVDLFFSSMTDTNSLKPEVFFFLKKIQRVTQSIDPTVDEENYMKQ